MSSFFSEMQMKDREFYYSVDPDNAGKLWNVVWVHTYCKYVYLEFHEVVCFDTTYLVNQWCMPFASFIGVNQHCQSILLGCALITSEDIDTYKFFFTTWLCPMHGVKPTAMLTSQCESIKATIRQVMPETIYRYCIWHIFTKLAYRLKRVRDHKIARSEFKSIVLDAITINEFEGKWGEFIGKYGLENRNWFSNLYLEKEKWVSVYFKHYFWFGMLSTQRCEGMHAFFDGYINGQSSPKQFVEQYEIAVRAKYDKELYAENRSRYTEAGTFSGFEWKFQLQTRYTRTIYELFMVQVQRLFHCEISVAEDAAALDGVEKFNITDFSIKNDFNGNQFVYAMEYRPSGPYLDCNYKKTFNLLGLFTAIY
ncbi:protein FAR-RED IMPAIRED RESPONSE 1-like [Lycium ferocissimum]|uniref:protein FAR-RED IMPAIRED RESPONSE 1-like n=1 Tax=Lycium ferocissimum TaxID=112874 RepID=UPI002815E02A|nr:protein FAR-RED IMPAIRED RESPONSE 1-like [Lycium ferocissimum]